MAFKLRVGIFLEKEAFFWFEHLMKNWFIRR